MKTLSTIRTAAHHGRTAGLAVLALLSFGCGATSPGATLFEASSAQPATSSFLGSAGSFAVLAGTAVTCTGGTITGDVGVYPGTAITLTEGCTVTGTLNPPGTGAQAAYIDFLGAYNALAREPCPPGNVLPAPGDLAGLVLPPGVYCVAAGSTTTGTATLPATLTLDGPATGIWIFKIGTAGTGALTGTDFQVVMEDGTTPPCNNVYWWVAEAATMTDSHFVGTILAGAAITITRGTFDGDALAMAAVTMTNATASACGGGTPSVGCKDFVTGGGWIMLPGGAKGTFGVTGGMKHGKLRGHLEYHDQGLQGPKVRGTGVTAYTVVDAKSRHIEGTAQFNGKPGYTYQVDVVDNGEPGLDDMFSLKVLKDGVVVYSASGNLAGAKNGNIQLHKKCRPMVCLPSNEGEDEHEDERD